MHPLNNSRGTKKQESRICFPMRVTPLLSINHMRISFPLTSRDYHVSSLLSGGLELSWLCAYSYKLILSSTCHCFLLKDFIPLFLDRGEGRETERERNIADRLPLTPSNWGPGEQPRFVPWLETEPGTFSSQAGTQSTGPHSQGSLTL